MAKTTKPNVAKTTPAKAVKPVAKEDKQVEKKPAVKKESPAKKETPKPVAAKALVKKPVIKTVAPKPAEKPVPKKAEPVKPEEKKVIVAKPAIQSAEKKIEPAKAAATKVATSKPVEKQVVKKAPVAKSADKNKKETVSAPVKNPVSTVNLEPPQDTGEVTIEKKLIALYNLQQIDSQVDKIRIIRGELPLEVQDLEDEIAGLETRIENYVQENSALEKSVTEKKFAIKDSQGLIKKYEEQQMNVRNNREYDSLTKEIEIQSLEIQLSEKRIREFQLALEAKTEEINRFQAILTDRKNDLEIKKNELDDIVAETEKEENELIKKSEINRKYIEERLITAYTRIRKNARNGLAVVQIERDACGGCFNKIPPQHQLDIRMHKKIIVCEYCGRILVDDGIVNLVH
jgi:predicted  nucleic acid-binding Zn-ribbon protein